MMMKIGYVNQYPKIIEIALLSFEVFPLDIPQLLKKIYKFYQLHSL